MGNLWQPPPSADPLEPLDDFADVLVWRVLDTHMDMLTRYLPGNALELVFDRTLPHPVSCPDRHLARQHALAILGNPEQMPRQVRLRLCPNLVTSHGDTYYLRFA